ncbi:MAG: molybdenum cofactor guanylyltransferase MobA [Immundisolibacter sp.]|uniref:molybdenum cofactor guanylyltransferase MobA n=1 Tax=Immundisolibacter sp. TaxID=1934948 RepID=UPI003D114306
MHGHPATHSAHRRTLTGLILAGGRGSRLGGIDKGLLDVRGTPLVQQVAARLAGQVDALLLSANRSLDRYRALGFDPLTDGPYVDAGPLAGIRAGLAACATDWLLAVPCDMPFVPLDLRARLLGAAPQDDCRARVPFDGEHHHYACVLLPGTALGAVTAALDAGRRSLRGLLDDIGWLGVDFAADRHAFTNLNTPADVAGALSAESS